MKRNVIVACLASITFVAGSSFAQSPSPAPSASPAAHSGGRLVTLSAEERQTLVAAMQKARQDPAVQAAAAKIQDAMRDYREAMHKVMSADPAVAAILAKVPQSGGMGMGMGRTGRMGQQGGAEPGASPAASPE